MIKLEQTNAGVQALAVISIQSMGEQPSISVTAEQGVRANVNGSWVDDLTKAKQSLSFLGADGPVTLSANVPEAEAVDAGAVWKVVAVCSLRRELGATFEAGRRSRESTALSLERVVEVWGGAKNLLWRAPSWQQDAKGGRTVDLAGEKASVKSA